MRAFTVPAHPKLAKRFGARKDHWMLFDTPAELAAWAVANCSTGSHWDRRANDWHGESSDDAARLTTSGDLSRVARSDALLGRFERFAFETTRKAWRDDIAGGFPNVPAYLAGHPLAMRRRAPAESAAAPLAVVVDLSTSAGISADAIERRGAAILALVRMLAMRRPVELWAGTGLDADRRQNASLIFCKLETAPLDLATAAYIMTSASFPRALCYNIGHVAHNFGGGWPYGDASTRHHFAEMCAAGFTHADALLAIPAAHNDDAIGKDPEGWIERKLAELAPVAADEAA